MLWQVRRTDDRSKERERERKELRLGAIEFLIKRDSGKEIDISRLYLYYNARLIESDDEQSIDDVGVSIDGGVAALKKYGSCKEENHPYAESVVNDRPPAHCYEEGKRFRLDSSEAMDADLNQMKCCLADGFPFLFGLECFPSFSQSETNGGLVSMPKADRGEQAYGCHAMLAVGYLDDRQVFIVRNSYGDQWVRFSSRSLTWKENVAFRATKATSTFPSIT